MLSAIDTLLELDLKAAARLIPGRNNKPTSITTIWRWIANGVKLRNGSRLRLQAIRYPGGWRTRREWIDEFLDALTNDRIGQDQDDIGQARDEPDRRATIPHRHRTPAQRRAAASRAAAELAAMGC
jgi:hypothetical protein